jgi:hypothetical protein
LEFWLAADERLRQLKKKRLSQDKARFAQFQAARSKVHPIMRRALRNEISVEDAAKRIRRLVPGEELRHEIFNFWEKASRTTPQQLEKEKDEIKWEELAIAKSERLLKAAKSINTGLTTLFEMGIAGDAKAANDLVEAAIDAAGFLYFLEKKCPQVIEPLARTNLQWPVLANDEPGWEKEAARRVSSLKLGMDMLMYKVRFREARGADTNLPARLWAKAAVRTIEESRCRRLFFGLLLRKSGSACELADFCIENGWNHGTSPDWLNDAVKLKSFSSETLPEWKRVVRKMIRQQIPDFHLRPEWATQRNSASARGRDTTGEIQNAILDDIGSALERIAPAKEMPKSVC